MNKIWEMRRAWALNKWLVLVLLASVHMACSRGENVLIYDPDSNLNPVVTSAPQARSDDPTNYFANGGVESGVEPWSYQGNSVAINQSAVHAHSGTYSLSVTGRQQDWHGPIMSLPRDLPLGEDYLVTVWVRLADNTQQSTVSATIKRQVAGADQYLSIDSAVVPIGQWVMLAGTYAHDVAADGGGDFYIYLESPNATASFYVDDLALRNANLAINGGGEAGTEGWARFGENPSITQVATPTRSGSYSLSVTGRTADWQGASFSFAPLDQGATYNFSCWVRLADDYEDSSVTLSIKLDDGAEDDKFFNLHTQSASPSEWVQVSGDYTHTPQGTVNELTAYVQAGSASAEYFIDDCSVGFVSAPVVEVSHLPLPPPAEWVPNGGVEEGVEPWSGVPAEVHISQSSEQSHSGNYSLLVTNRSEDWHGPTMPLPSALPRGESYVASVWVRLTAGTAASAVQLSLKRVVDGEEQYLTLAEGEATDGTWTRLRGIYEHDLTPDAVLGDFYFYIESPKVTADYYVDDLTLRPI